ncbi:MAG TPA: glycosyltransferase [Solirubrobacterales bacterium]|nr:glycosyltransferase [Solirubrobacterales bacterium]
MLEEGHGGAHPAQEGRPLRLGVYVDAVFRCDGDRLYTYSLGFPIMVFVAEVGKNFAEMRVVGRAVEAGAGTDYELPAGLRLTPLPYYEDLRRVRPVLRSIGGTLRGMWRGLPSVDAVWIFGPHPFSLVFILLALMRRRRVVLGVRQDTMGYFRARLPSRRWLPILLPLWLVDRAFRLLARVLPAVVVGAQLEHAYGGPRAGLLPTTISLTASSEISNAPGAKDWSGVKELLTVGRVEPEKNPILVVDALAELNRRRPNEYRLTWAGIGRMEETTRMRAAALGVERNLVLAGFVPHGPSLLAMYRSAHILIHVSLTEGLPHVLIEAMATGTPIVATDVGSVADAVEGGRAGVLIPAGDRDALVDAVLRLTDDQHLRDRCVERGLIIGRRHALDVEAARVAEFIAAAISRDHA